MQGNKPDPKQAWYLTRELACPLCGAVFQLEPRDFEGREVGANYDEPTWRVTMTERSPNGKQTIAGKCPDCKEGISVTQKMGGAA
jgi:hypothetical protein